MWFFQLLACAAQATTATQVDAPTDWFWAGAAIDPASLTFRGADVVFETVGTDLRTGALGGAGWLACGDATRATLVFEAGALQDVVTVPYVPCVEDAARALDWSDLPLEGEPLVAAPRAVLVYEVGSEPHA
jgi:hypothetical protein